MLGVLLLLVVLIQLSCGLLEELVNPAKLLIATVVDLSNDEVLRDTFTLIRSIRWFGGSISKSTVRVGLITDNVRTFSNLTVIKRFSEYECEIFFINPAKNLSRTLNKFSAFYLFDPNIFDYFLWLDGDVVVFRDPRRHFQLHRYPGEVHCVPDVYTYMRRFPRVNESDFLWQSSNPMMELVGTGEVSPHGSCNTGVLLFDRHSLGRFMVVYDQIRLLVTHNNYNVLPISAQTKGKEEMLHLLRKYGNDRFIDSLLFVYIINTVHINMLLLPISANYMALFEDEFFELVLDRSIEGQQVELGHFVSDTTLHCTQQVTTDADGEEVSKCHCNYTNSLMPTVSLLKKEVAAIMATPGSCEKLAGIMGPPPNTGAHSSAVAAESSQTLIDCALLQPVYSDAHASGRVIVAVVDIDDDEAGWDLAVELACILNPLIDSSPYRQILSEDLWVDVEIASPCGSCEAGQFNLSKANLKLKRATSDDNITFSMRTILQLDLRSAVSSYSTLRKLPIVLSFAVFGMTADETAPESGMALYYYLFNLRSELQLLIEAYEPLGVVAYGANLLFGSRNINLAAQRDLPAFVDRLFRPSKHARSLHSAVNLYELAQRTGAVFCCDTQMGVAVTRQFINQRWSVPQTVIIFVAFAPSDRSVQSLASELREACNSRIVEGGSRFFANCVILQQTLNHEENLINVAKESIYYVYLDVYQSYHALSDRLDMVYSQWLHKHAVIAGSRYFDAQRLSSCAGVDCRWRRQYQQAVDSFALRIRRRYLLTFDENCSSDEKRSGEAIDDSCFPAWYIIKS